MRANVDVNVGMLQIPQMTKTARMMGILPIYIGMPVRITRKISPALGLVPEATGVVVGISFAPEERIPWESDPEDPAWSQGWVTLKYLPQAIMVKIDDSVEQYSKNEAPGILAVTPQSDTTDELWVCQQKTRFNRTQFPLAPRDVLTVQAMQGVTSPYLVANLAGGENLNTEHSRENYWVHVYVMLSRVKRIGDLIVVNAPDNLRQILEAGPPVHVIQEMFIAWIISLTLICVISKKTFCSPESMLYISTRYSANIVIFTSTLGRDCTSWRSKRYRKR